MLYDAGRTIFENLNQRQMKINLDRWNIHSGFGETLGQVVERNFSGQFVGMGISEVSFIGNSSDRTVTPESSGRGVFIITYYASFEDRGSVSFPERLFGVSGHDFRKLLNPSGKGMLIYDDEGVPAAELIGNHLCLLIGISFLPQIENYRMMFEQILERALKLVNYFPSLESILTETYDKKKFEGYVHQKFDYRVSKTELRAQVALVPALVKEISLRSSSEDSKALLERIALIPEIKTLSVERDTLTIETYVICVYDKTGVKLYELGEFRIELSFGRDQEVSFKNITRKVDYPGYNWRGNAAGEYGHPHVHRPNGWCKGEGKGIINLLNEYEFEAAILFALQVIYTVNEDDHYQEVLRLFPVVERRFEFPTEKAIEVTPEMVAAFNRIWSNSMRVRNEKGKNDLAALIHKIKFYQGRVAQGVFNEKRIPKGIASIKTHLESQLASLKEIPGIKNAKFKEDTLIVTTGKLTIKLGLSGSVEVSPFDHPDKWWGEGNLPIGQHTLTIPELVGNLNFVTAVTMLFSVIAEFDKKDLTQE